MNYKGYIRSIDNNNVYIETLFQGATPFFTISDTILRATEMLLETTFIETPNNKYILLDDDNNEVECTFICNFIHPLNRIPSCIYYNPINGSYFVTVNPDVVDPSTCKHVYKSIGYFGLGVNNKDASHGLSLILDVNPIKNLPVPNTESFKNVNIRICSFYGLMSKYTANFRVNSGTSNAIYVKTNYNVVIEIPRYVINSPLHTYTITPDRLTKFNIDYAGKTEPDNYYVILPY